MSISESKIESRFVIEEIFSNDEDIDDKINCELSHNIKQMHKKKSGFNFKKVFRYKELRSSLNGINICMIKLPQGKWENFNNLYKKSYLEFNLKESVIDFNQESDSFQIKDFIDNPSDLDNQIWSINQLLFLNENNIKNGVMKKNNKKKKFYRQAQLSIKKRFVSVAIQTEDHCTTNLEELTNEDSNTEYKTIKKSVICKWSLKNIHKEKTFRKLTEQEDINHVSNEFFKRKKEIEGRNTNKIKLMISPDISPIKNLNRIHNESKIKFRKSKKFILINEINLSIVNFKPSCIKLDVNTE